MLVPTCSNPDTTLLMTMAFRYIHGPGLILSTVLERSFDIQRSLSLIMWLAPGLLAIPSLRYPRRGSYVDTRADVAELVNQRTWRWRQDLFAFPPCQPMPISCTSGSVPWRQGRSSCSG